jgi:hypothetical protein
MLAEGTQTVMTAFTDDICETLCRGSPIRDMQCRWADLVNVRDQLTGPTIDVPKILIWISNVM